MNRIRRNCSLLAPALWIATAIGHAQVNFATVTGALLDQTGAVMSDTTVTLTNVNTGVVSTVTTNDLGTYRISGLIPGLYKETLSKNGFKSINKDQIELHAADVVELNFTFEIGSTSETVTVAAGEPLIDTEKTSIGDTIEGRQVEESPLNGRNAMNLIALSPGVVPGGSSQGSVVDSQRGSFNPAAMGNYSIGGAISGWNSTNVDGVSVNATGQNWQMFTPTQDSVAEFRVDVNAPSPQYGRFAGGVTNFSTKSGTNQFHGTAYEYLRNTILDANTFFNDRLAQPVPKLHQHQFGATSGGPIFHNKSFFFGSWEGLRILSEGSGNFRVPTPAEMSGDFTASSTPIMDYKTGAQAQCNGVLNKFCSNELDPVSQIMYKIGYFAPMEANPAKLALLQANGYNATVLQKQPNNSSEYVLRLDHQLTSSQRLFGRYTQWDLNIPLAANLPSPAVPSGPQTLHSKQFLIGDNYTISPTLNADFRLSYSRFHFDFDSAQNGNWDLSQLGSAWAAVGAQLLYKAPPEFCCNSWSYMPNTTDLDQHNYDDQYSLSANFTKVHGHHSFQFGADLRRLEFYSVSSFNTGGQFYTPGISGFVEGVTLSVGGQTQMQQVLQPQAYSYYQGYYVNDSWQISPSLTANLGVRWELPGDWKERKDRDAVLLPNTPNPLGSFANPVSGGPTAPMGIIAAVNSPQYTSHAQTEFHYHLFEPRVGLNYSVDSHTVVRAGFGITNPCLDCGSANMAVASSAFESATTLDPTPYTNPNGVSYGLLSNPYPNGVAIPQGRSTTSMQPYSQNKETLIGQSISGQIPYSTYPSAIQWNLSTERAFGASTSAMIAYIGSRGLHLNTQDINLNQLPDKYDSLGTTLNTAVANPLYGIASPLGSVGGRTALYGQFLTPYPEFSKVTANGLAWGESSYHALIAQIKRRLGNGGLLNASYTWAHQISNEDTPNGYLEAGAGNSGIGNQDYTNPAADKSNSSSDVRQRLLLQYILDIPVGRGKRFLGTANRAVDAVIGGWSLSGITTFQSGFPLGITTNAGNQLSANFGAGTIRPNVVPGAQKKASGSRYDRTLPNRTWFNTAAFSLPGAYAFGNESRLDSTLRADGIQNWDVDLAKAFAITDRFKLQFKAEYFNVFNRPQFAPPGLGADSANSFGIVTGTTNSPRIGQLSLRLDY